MARGTEPVFPTELWAHIMQYCGCDTLRNLILVSRSCCEDARRRLYHSVYFGQGSKSYGSGSHSIRIHDLAQFRRFISAWSGWRSSMRRVHLCWTNNGSPQCWREPDRFETEGEAQLNDFVTDTANVLAESAALQSLHLSIPLLNSRVPFALTRVDSLTVPITDCLHQDPDFATLLRLFQIPTLRHVELDQLIRLNVPIPEHCRRPGTSDVTHLLFHLCGPVHEEIAHLLSWPKDLQTVEFRIGVAAGLNDYAYDSGSVTMATVPRALWPLEKCLQDLTVEVLDGGSGDPLQEDAFQSFSKLWRMNVPIEMFLDLSSGPPCEPTMPIHTRLPQSLEQLIIQLPGNFVWGDRNEGKLSEEAESLLSYLSGLAEHADQRFPKLKDFRISCGFHRQDHDRLYMFPLEFPRNRQFVDLLRSSGISVSFW